MQEEHKAMFYHLRPAGKKDCSDKVDGSENTNKWQLSSSKFLMAHVFDIQIRQGRETPLLRSLMMIRGFSFWLNSLCWIASPKKAPIEIEDFFQKLQFQALVQKWNVFGQSEFPESFVLLLFFPRDLKPTVEAVKRTLRSEWCCTENCFQVNFELFQRK